MIDAIKDYLTPKTFSIWAYVCSIVHFLCGLVITGIVIALLIGGMLGNLLATSKAGKQKVCL